MSKQGMEEKNKVVVTSRRDDDQYGKMHSYRKMQRAGASPLVLRLYEDWTEPVDRDLVEIVKAKKEILPPPPKQKAESKPKPPKKEKAISVKVAKPKAEPKSKTVRKIYSGSIRQRFKVLLPQILYSDRAIGLETVQAKAIALGLDIVYDLVKEYLYQFSKEGIVFRTVREHKYNAYALTDTDVIDKDEWLPASIAYQIALSNGYSDSYRFFCNRPYSTNISDERIAEFYAQYGLEYRFGHKYGENHKWRVKWER